MRYYAKTQQNAFLENVFRNESKTPRFYRKKRHTLNVDLRQGVIMNRTKNVLLHWHRIMAAYKYRMAKNRNPNRFPIFAPVTVETPMGDNIPAIPIYKSY